MKSKKWCFAIALLMFTTGCNKVSEQQLSPLRGIAWFTEMEEVKNVLSDMELIAERESGEGTQKQYLLDYSGANLFETDCDFTICCTSQGFAGVNYHDIEHVKTYHQWLTQLEDIYGLPTEKGNGMASWYQNPVGKNTAVYLFNLEEGIQVSFYAVSDSPDKSYEKQQDEQKPEVFIPTPELRTPVIPAENTPLMQNDVETLSTNESNSQESKPLSQLENGDSLESLPLDEEDLLENGDIPENTNSISENGQLPNESLSPAEMETISTAVTTARNAPQNVTTTVAIATTAPPKPQTQPPKTEAVIPETQPPKKEEVVNPAESYLLKGLQFYGGIDSERRKMSSYTQLYEYRSEEAGQPWQLIMEYENVPYLNRKCDAVLCFTSLGLVGINYFDGNTGNYRDWVNQLTDIYGSASDSQSDYTAWTGNPVGSGTAIYIFALEDGVQISFFADDSGSALS